MLRFSSRDLHVLQDETYDIYHGPDHMGSPAHEMAEEHLRSSMTRLMREWEASHTPITTVPSSFSAEMTAAVERRHRTMNEGERTYQFAVPTSIADEERQGLYRPNPEPSSSDQGRYEAQIRRFEDIAEIHRRTVEQGGPVTYRPIVAPFGGEPTNNCSHVEIETVMQGDTPLPPRKWHIHMVRIRTESYPLRSIGRPQYLRKYYNLNNNNGTYTEERTETVTPGNARGYRSDRKGDS